MSDIKTNGHWVDSGPNIEMTTDPKAEEKAIKSSTLAEITSFCAETTAHGLGYTVKSNDLFVFRVIWIVIFTCALIGNCWHLSTVVRAYLARPVQEVTTLTQEDIRFPYVTLCNQIPLSLSNQQAMENDSSSEYSQYLQRLASNSASFVTYESQTGIAMDDLLGSPNGLYANVNHSELISLGHTLRNMVIYCSYGGVECDLENDFEQFFDPTYFNCYTFTGKATVGDASVGSGPRDGLSLILFLESLIDGQDNLDSIYNRYSNTENSYGVRIQVHESDTLPNPRDSGFNAMSGQSTSVDLSATEIVRLASPYGHCVKTSTLAGLEQYLYSEDRCLDVCLSRYITTQCGCISSQYTVPNDMPTNTKFCDLLNDTNIQTLFENFECENEAWVAFSRSATLKADCGCIEPCRRYEFQHSVSQSLWPGKRYMRDMYYEFVTSHANYSSLKAFNQVNHLINDSSRVADMKENILDNFARVNVYFGHTGVTEHAQQPSYSFAALWSNIGGTIGLWAGLSIITILEVIYLFIRLCLVCCKEAKNRSKLQSLN